jgi:hypothetical protein
MTGRRQGTPEFEPKNFENNNTGEDNATQHNATQTTMACEEK